MGKEDALGYKISKFPLSKGLNRETLMKSETLQESSNSVLTAMNPELLANKEGHNRD